MHLIEENLHSLCKTPIKLQKNQRFIGAPTINHKKNGFFIGAV